MIGKFFIQLEGCDEPLPKSCEDMDQALRIAEVFSEMYEKDASVWGWGWMGEDRQPVCRTVSWEWGVLA